MTQPDNTVRADSGHSDYENLQFKTFDYTEYKPQDMQNDLDPEIGRAHV